MRDVFEQEGFPQPRMSSALDFEPEGLTAYLNQVLDAYVEENSQESGALFLLRKSQARLLDRKQV